MILGEITGYITVPFHGEKGDSAYEVAVKYGYEGTEQEWVNSLGFIPDKSIGERKLTDALVAKLKEYESFIGEVFDKKTGFEECFVNVYREAGDKAVPYTQIGSSGYKVKIPRVAENVKVFDENDTSLWSAESGEYRLSKLDVSDMVGMKVRISGVANTVPPYVCAVCVDENGNILARYGESKNTVYGYSDAGVDLVTYSYADAIETIVPEGAKYIYIAGKTFTSGGVLVCDAVSKLEIERVKSFVPNDKYKRMQSPLWGKKLYVDGDSICYGNGYTGGYGKIIADMFDMELINNGVGGATISMGASDAVSYTTPLDWENEQYYLKLSGTEPVSERTVDGFVIPITKDIYENGFGVYPTLYKVVNGVIEKQEYTDVLKEGKAFIKFEVPTYDGNTVDKYYRIWCYLDAEGKPTGNYWLWEAYKSGFRQAHETQKTIIGKARHWLSTAAEEVDTAADYIIFEGGLNDYLMNRPIGQITQDMTSPVDITTVTGGMEYLCRVLLKKCIGKKLLFVLTPKAKNYAHLKNQDHAGNKTLTDYHDAMLSVLKKYSIPYVDLFEKSAFNTEIADYLAYTVNRDGVHPTKSGYDMFYVPKILHAAEML